MPFTIVGTRYPGDHVLVAEEFPHDRCVHRIGNAWTALFPPQNQSTVQAIRRNAALAATIAMSRGGHDHTHRIDQVSLP